MWVHRSCCERLRQPRCRLWVDTVSENCIFHISPMYEFLHRVIPQERSQNRPTCPSHWEDIHLLKVHAELSETGRPVASQHSSQHCWNSSVLGRFSGPLRRLVHCEHNIFRSEPEQPAEPEHPAKSGRDR